MKFMKIREHKLSHKGNNQSRISEISEHKPGYYLDNHNYVKIFKIVPQAYVQKTLVISLTVTV